MDLATGATVAGFREEVRDFIAQSVPQDWQGLGALAADEVEPFIEAWRGRLAQAGLLAPTWPREHGGRGLGVQERIVLLAELTRRGLPDGGLNDVFGVGMLGNTLLEHGTIEQRRELLPRILDGRDRWCQGFSEPDAGSDLAAVATTARLEGDQWVINGQKIWTSAAQTANRIFVLCRTGSSDSRHRGLTLILCDMEQPGVQVRPITMLSGAQEFNEVFLTDARAPRDATVGEVDSGWGVAMTLLGFERGENLPGLALRYRAELDRLIDLVRSGPAAHDPEIRTRLARLHSRVEALRFLGDRVASRLVADVPTGAPAMIAKLFLSEVHAELLNLGVDALGDSALEVSGRQPHAAFHVDDSGTPGTSAPWLTGYLHSQGELIAAGTSEIQRNIIGERVLGLPR